MRRRPLAAVSALLRQASLASGLLRAGGIILFVSALFIAVLGSMDHGGDTAETVKMPNVVKATRVAPRRTIETRRAEPKNVAWWLTPGEEFPQFFLEEGARTPADLCRRLAAIGYSRARWNESEVFKGEWECSSPLDRKNEQRRAFLLVRGASERRLSSLMLKLASLDNGERPPLIDKAREAVLAFAQTAGLVLSSDALPLLSGWETGRTWTSQGTFTIVAEAGKPGTRVVSVATNSTLARPADATCDEACRGRFAFLATRAVKRRPVASEPRSPYPNAASPERERTSAASPFGLR